MGPVDLRPLGRRRDRPENPFVWYNRAQAYARKGDRKRALADLQTSVDKGWKDLAALQQEEAFAPLRQDAEYQRILLAWRHLRAGAGAAPVSRKPIP